MPFGISPGVPHVWLGRTETEHITIVKVHLNKKVIIEQIYHKTQTNQADTCISTTPPAVAIITSHSKNLESSIYCVNKVQLDNTVMLKQE